MRKLVLAFVALTAGCDSRSPTPAFGQTDQQASEMRLLKSQVDQLQKDLIDVRVKADRNTWTNMKTNENGYSVVNTDGMPLAFMLGDVSPSASGSKVALKIGNPSTATITRLHLYLNYGKATNEGLLTEPVLSKEETVTTPLPPGQWTEVSIGLPNLPPKDLGIVRINGANPEALSFTQP